MSDHNYHKKEMKENFQEFLPLLAGGITRSMVTAAGAAESLTGMTTKGTLANQGIITSLTKNGISEAE